jgi:hypothetical protein
MLGLVRSAVVVSAVLLLAGPREYPVDWPALEKAFAAYLHEPGVRTAKRFTRILPPGTADRRTATFDANSVNRLYARLDELDKLVGEGRHHALDVAFALFSVSDGHFTEELLAMIPSAIDADPAAFLGALKTNRSRPFATCELAGNVGLDYVDDRQGKLAVLERRLRRVEGVEDPDLKEPRDCVARYLRQVLAVVQR